MSIVGEMKDEEIWKLKNEHKAYVEDLRNAHTIKLTKLKKRFARELEEIRTTTKTTGLADKKLVALRDNYAPEQYT